MPRIIKKLGFTLVILATATTIGLACLSFSRKVGSFARPGFAYVRSGGSLVVTSVEPDSPARVAGLSPGDRIITADGQTASSLPDPARSLARRPFPHRLLVLSRGEVREAALSAPRVQLDRTYLFLALVGVLYLAIGLFTIARDRTPAARTFFVLCLSSFAVYLLTPAGPYDALWKVSLLAEDIYRALLPALLLHFFLLFPSPVRPRGFLPLLYLPGVLYLLVQEAPLAMSGLAPDRTLEWATRAWSAYFGLFAAAVLLRLAWLLRRRVDAEAEKQLRWISLGVAVGLAPFLLLSVLPRAFGLASPWLSSLAVVPLVLIPLAFAYAILKWRLWDVEMFVREAIATTGAVLLGGMTFVLLNSLLDRTLGSMTEGSKNVIAFGSGLVLASMLVPVKRRLTDVLEKLQYHDTYRARRALLDVARDFSTPRPRAELVRALVQRVEEALHVVPCTLFFLEGAGLAPEDAELLGSKLAREEIWRLRGSAFGPGEADAAIRLHEVGYRTFFAMRCGGKLVGALGVGHKDGRVPLSSEDDSLLLAVMAQAALAYENARLYGALAERLEQIRTLQQYQESVIRSSSSGILVLGGDDRIHSANPAFAALVGREERELIGLSFDEVLPGVRLPTSPEEDECAIEARFTNGRREERDLRLSVSAFQGEPDRKVVLVDDVTDRIRAERAIAERERLASLGGLAAGVAHEVNTPIAGLSSYAQLLLADTAPGDPRYLILKKMERQTFRAAHLVNNLLEFARPRPSARMRVDLRGVLANAAESVEPTLGTRRLSLERPEAGEALWVLGDARELEQVFVNLFTNARDASPEAGEVLCLLRRNGDALRVVIADRGPGLPSGAGEKLFQPFFTTKKTGGTGLGLAISREIVRRHGGDIELGPREGGGTEAVVTLPLAAPTP